MTMVMMVVVVVMASSWFETHVIHIHKMLTLHEILGILDGIHKALCY